jgi:hypothetical protein
VENFKKLAYIFLNYLCTGLFFATLWYFIPPSHTLIQIAFGFSTGVLWAFWFSSDFGDNEDPHFVKNCLIHILISSSLIGFMIALADYLTYHNWQASLTSFFIMTLVYIIIEIILIAGVKFFKALWTKFKPNREKEESDAS